MTTVRCGYLYTAMLLLALGLTPSFAQTDSRAEELLMGAFQSIDAAEVDVRTLDQTLVVQSFESNGSASPEGRVRMVVDVEGRRLYGESVMDGELLMTFLYTDGQATVFFPQQDMRFPMPEEAARQLEATFEQAAAPASNLIPTDYTSASYDGRHAYEGVLEGEQVTVTTPEGEVKLIFNEAGRLIGAIHDRSEQGAILTVFDQTVQVTDYPSLMSSLLTASTYLLEDGQATLTGTVRVEEFILNAAIDEALFSLE